MFIETPHPHALSPRGPICVLSGFQNGFFRKDTICLKCHLDRFLEIGSGFLKRFALRVGTGAILQQIRCILLGHFRVLGYVDSIFLYTLRSAGARGLDGLPSIDILLRWSEGQRERNADLRSLRINLTNAGLGSGKMPDLRGF